MNYQNTDSIGRMSGRVVRMGLIDLFLGYPFGGQDYLTYYIMF